MTQTGPRQDDPDMTQTRPRLDPDRSQGIEEEKT